MRASLVNLSANSFGMPAFVPDDTYGTVVAGVATSISQAITANVQYTGSFGQGDIDSHGVSAWLNIGF